MLSDKNPFKTLQLQQLKDKCLSGYICVLMRQ